MLSAPSLDAGKKEVIGFQRRSDRLPYSVPAYISQLEKNINKSNPATTITIVFIVITTTIIIGP